MRGRQPAPYKLKSLLGKRSEIGCSVTRSPCVVAPLLEHSRAAGYALAVGAKLVNPLRSQPTLRCLETTQRNVGRVEAFLAAEGDLGGVDKADRKRALQLTGI